LLADVANVDGCVVEVLEKPRDEYLQVSIRIHDFALVHRNEDSVVSISKLRL